MTATRMSTFVWTGAALTLAGLLSGCTRGRHAGIYDSKPVATLPMYPASAEYQGNSGVAAEPQHVAQSAGGGCSSGSCGSCREGGSGCCSSGSCGMSRTATAAGPSGMQRSQVYGDAMADTRLGQNNSLPPSAAAFGGQKTCPVTDEPLGSMGPPVPVAVKGQTIYVCCEGCADTVQADPDLYLAKVMRERGGQ
jgi:hypothetical protein